MEIGKALSRLPLKVLWKLSKKEAPDQAAIDALALAGNVRVRVLLHVLLWTLFCISIGRNREIIEKLV